MTDRYAVFGNPVAHSKSPQIHALFAAQTGQDLSYDARLVPLGEFAPTVRQLADAGLRGANVTVPFKEDAFRLATRLSARALRAGAVNTLVFSGPEILGENTDGAGLLRDLRSNLAVNLDGCRVLLLGAGGAARGALAPLLAERPASVFIANRTVDKASALVRLFSELGSLEAGGFSSLSSRQFDLVINATSASLDGELPPVGPGIFAPGALAYDMMYGPADTPFIGLARSANTVRCADGLGMLVEQAAESFFLWRGVRPETGPVLTEMRRRLAL